MSDFTLLSYNIHKGYRIGNRTHVLDDIKQAIRQENADIVCLQEVVGDHVHKNHMLHNWQTNAQFEFLADEVWPHFAYGKNAVYTQGHHGNAILSRFPLEWENIDVSTNPMEKRGLLHATIPVPLTEIKLDVICLHLNILESGRSKQIDQLCQRVSEVIDKDNPLIICGDFNDWRKKVNSKLEIRLGMKEAFKELIGNNPRTFPSFFPILPLDRIYYRNLEIKKGELLSGPPWNNLSDHLALKTSFSF